MKENVYKDIYKMLVDKLRNRLMELQPTDLAEINSALQIFNKAITILKAVQLDTEKVLDTLENLTFTSSDELKECEGELYITSNFNSMDKPEIILRKSEEENRVYFDRKNEDGIIETRSLGKNGFYRRYCKLIDRINPTDFIGNLCYAEYLGKKLIVTLLYSYEILGISIILTDEDEILIVQNSTLSAFCGYEVDNASKKYKDKQVLYDKIYDSLFGKVEEIKLKREKNI